MDRAGKLFFLSFLWAMSPAVAMDGVTCSEALAAQGDAAYVALNFSHLELDAQAASTVYSDILANEPTFETLLPRNIVSYILWDPAFHYLVPSLRTLVMEFQRIGRENPSVSMEERWLSVLQNFTPSPPLAPSPLDLNDRKLFLSSENPSQVAQALSAMTLQDVQRRIYGEDPLHPSPESLLGQYISSTGAATLIRRFGSTATGGSSGQQNFSGPLGPERLVIAVSQESLPEYVQLFSAPYFIVHAHGQNQGTLYVGFEGVGGNIVVARPSSGTTSLLRYSQGAIWPHLLLTTTEAGRVRRYFDLGGANTAFAKFPWQLPGYCATGFFACCTHWFGEMPIGDRYVTEYAFPFDPSNRTPRIAPLQNYPRISDPRLDFLTHQVWRLPRAPMQLYEVLGLRDAGMEGEFANPGWVAIRLTGSAPVERVPFVFYHVADHRQPIPPDFPTSISAR